MKIRSLACMMLLIVLLLGAVCGSNYDSAAAPLLDRIALGEGTGDAKAQKIGYDSGYDVLYGYQKPTDFDANYPGSLTEMTLSQVKELQEKMSSSAIGKYQFLYSTLWGTETNPTGGLISRLGLSLTDTFNAETQDKLALALLEDCGYSKWKRETPSEEADRAFQYKIAGIWASVENPYLAGKSRYRVNGEPCLSTSSDCQSVGTTSDQIKEAMAQTRTLLGISLDKKEENTPGPMRTPKKGDRVFIYSGLSSGYKGTITDIENGLICLDRTDGSSTEDGETDTCIGIESIRMISWVD